MSETPTVDDLKVQNVIAALKVGHYVERAAKLSRVNPSTIYIWKQKGEEERRRLEKGEKKTEAGQKYLKILEEIESAQEQAAHRALITIQKASQDGSWQAAAWYLERTDARHYGRKTILVGHDEGPVQVQAVSAESVDAKLKELIDAAEASQLERTREIEGTS